MVYDIITVGSAVVDVFLETDIKEEGNKLCLPGGEKVVVNSLWTATGGGGTNSAVSFSRLGFKTGFCGKLGRDENARIILSELKKEKVDFLGVQGSKSTGYSVIVDGIHKNRTILSYKGANEFLYFNEVNLQKLKTNLIYLSAMIGNSLETEEKVSAWAAKNKIKIAYNPGNYLKKKERDLLKKILKRTNILILNESEARGIVKSGDLFKGLLKLGPEIVCITYGEKGNVVCDKKNIYTAKPNKIKAKERTGAGDAFSSGFIFGYVRKGNIFDAIKIGSLNAESVIQKIGAKNGLLTLKEIENEQKRNKIKIKKKQFFI